MHKIGIIFLFFTLSSCDNSSDSSAIIGSWINDACEQLTYSNGQPVNAWVKSTYTFDTSGSIYSESTSYSDSNCISKSNDIQTQSLLVAIFSEQGPTITSQGIEADKITIRLSSALSSTITTSGYYKITNNQLCLSTSFHLDADGIGIAQTNDTEIAFYNCLTKR